MGTEWDDQWLPVAGRCHHTCCLESRNTLLHHPPAQQPPFQPPAPILALALGFDPTNLEAQFTASFVATVSLSGQPLAFEVMAGLEVGPQGGLMAMLSGQTLSAFAVNKWLTLNFLEISATVTAEDGFPTDLSFASRCVS